MKTEIRLLSVFFLSVFCLSALAQIGKVIVFAPKGEKFTLFMGKTMQNSEPATRVESDNPGGPTYKLRVVFPDPSIDEISKLVFNKPHGTMYFKVDKNAKGKYILESATSEWLDDAPGSVKETSPPPSPPGTTPDTKESKPEEAKTRDPVKNSTAKGCDKPVSDPDFTPLLIDISARPFEPMQLSAAKKMAETHCITVLQVKMVIAVFDSESSRLSFAKHAYDYTYDKDNYSEVNEVLHSQKSRDDLDRYVAGKKK